MTHLNKFTYTQHSIIIILNIYFVLFVINLNRKLNTHYVVLFQFVQVTNTYTQLLAPKIISNMELFTLNLSCFYLLQACLLLCWVVVSVLWMYRSRHRRECIPELRSVSNSGKNILLFRKCCGVSFSIVFILFTFLEILGTMPLIFRHFKNKIKWKSLLNRNYQQLISRREGRESLFDGRGKLIVGEDKKCKICPFKKCLKTIRI